MFKKFFRSPYIKAALTMLVCGALLILFNNMVSESQLSLGFETINRTLTPIYIGVAFAFLLCPIYNKVVKHAYKYFSGRSRTVAVTSGPILSMPVTIESLNPEEDNRSSLALARATASVVCLVVLIGTISMAVYFVLPQFIQSAVELVTTAPDKLTAFSDWLAQNFTRFPAFTKWFDQIANAGTNEILRWIQEHLLKADNAEIATTISTSIFSIIGTAVNFFIGILIMVYLLNNKDRIAAIARKLTNAVCSEKKRDSIYEFIGIVNDTFLRFLSGRIIDGLIIGILTYLVMIILGISFAPMISVLVGITNIIPFFGPFIGAIPATLILLIQDPMEALYFVVMILVLQQVDGNIIGPKVVGNAIGIDSFMVLISVLIGGGLFGFMGMILGVPVFAIIYTYVNKLAVKALAGKDLNVATDDYFTLEKYDIDASTVAGRKQLMEKKLAQKQARKNRKKKTDDK